MTPRMFPLIVAALLAAGCNREPAAPVLAPQDEVAALAAFATIEQVFQHPRCSNCHIPGDSPLQFDAQTPHQMGVVRGADGHGAAGLPCSACHGEKNLPAGYDPASPPGAPNWHLPPADQKMAWIGVPPAQLCAMIKDPDQTGGKDLEAMFTHVVEDGLVLWGWDPGGTRVPVPVPHAEFTAAFRRWVDAGAPCPR